MRSADQNEGNGLNTQSTRGLHQYAPKTSRDLLLQVRAWASA